MRLRSSTTFLAALTAVATRAAAAPPPRPSPPVPPAFTDGPGELPATLTVTHDGFDFVRREVEIPMRDGLKLHTVILLPQGAKGAPILLTRTPYDADDMTAKNPSA